MTISIFKLFSTQIVHKYLQHLSQLDDTNHNCQLIQTIQLMILETLTMKTSIWSCKKSLRPKLQIKILVNQARLNYLNFKRKEEIWIENLCLFWYCGLCANQKWGKRIYWNLAQVINLKIGLEYKDFPFFVSHNVRWILPPFCMKKSDDTGNLLTIYSRSIHILVAIF